MKSILLFLFMAVAGIASAQSSYDSRLLAKFSEERIDELLISNPEVIAYWTYYLDNSYKILNQESGKDFETLETVSIQNLNNFNILTSGATMSRDRSNLYKIQGSDKLLLVLSNESFSEKFNQSQGH